MTCVKNWLEDFDLVENGNSSCPANSSHVTFRDMYGSSQGICNKMWAVAFY